MVNKTGYVLKLTEREFDSVSNREMETTPIEYFVKENNGKICLSDFANSNTTSQTKSVKKYKFTVKLDEYSVVDKLNLRNPSKNTVAITVNPMTNANLVRVFF